MSTQTEIRAWFTGRLPDGWFTGPPEVTSDNDEILVSGTLADPELAAGTAEDGQAAGRQARIDRFREETREARMKIADEAERQFGRKVAWAARAGDQDKTFTTLSIPVMTRLRMPERRGLDTPGAAGGAPPPAGGPGPRAGAGGGGPRGGVGAARPGRGRAGRCREAAHRPAGGGGR